MTFTTRISCPNCKKQTVVEISETQFAQIRKDVALRQKTGIYGTQETRFAANSGVHFSSATNRRDSAINGGRHNNRLHRDGNKGSISGTHALNHNVMVHCSGCDNLFTHYLPVHLLIEAEQSPRSPKSYSATNAHSRLHSVISNERQEKSTESAKFTDSTVETLTQHFDSFATADDISSSGISSSGLALFGLDSSGRTGEKASTIAQLSAITKRGLQIMVETTAFKLLFPSAVMLIGMMAMSMAPNNIFFTTLNTFWPPEHRVPESSIYIEGTQADEIKAINGKRFIAVTGTIRNDGTHSVRDVIIQALVYQADGTRIHDAVGFAHKTTTPQNSRTLADTEVSTIERSEIGQILNPPTTGTQKVITDISAIAQGDIPKRERELKAGQSQDFTIYVPVEDNQQKEDLLYSARIFAVSGAA